MEQITQAKQFDSLSISPQETAFTDEYLKDSATCAIKQIDMVIHRCKGDDLNLRAMENCKRSIEQLVEELDYRLDHEVNEYNNAVEIIEKLNEQLVEANELIRKLSDTVGTSKAMAREESTALADEMADMQLRCDRLESENKKLVADFENERLTFMNQQIEAATQLKQTRRDLAEYKQKMPLTLLTDIEKLEREAVKLRTGRREDAKERQNLSSSLHKTNSELHRSKSELSESKKRVAVLESVVADKTYQCEDLKDYLLRDSGHQDELVYHTPSAGGDNVRCCILTYHYHTSTDTVKNLTERDKHEGMNVYWQVETDTMHSMTVIASPWGRPVMSILPPLRAGWNAEITIALEGHIEKYMAEYMPRAYKRMMDGEQAMVSELNLSSRAQGVLSERGIVNVREVGALLSYEYEDMKGCGSATAKEIMNALITWENNWEKANEGAIEEYRKSKLPKITNKTDYNREKRRKITAMNKT